MNTCKQCIIQSMCKDPCDEFVKFLDRNINPQVNRRQYSMFLLAKAIRVGTHELCEDDTRWRFKDD